MPSYMQLTHGLVEKATVLSSITLVETKCHQGLTALILLGRYEVQR